jgi:hypothetical protein
MKKAKNAGNNGNASVNPTVLAATDKIRVLCAAASLTPTNKFAVMKDLHPESGHENRFTSWAKNEKGEKGLVVLDPMGDSIKFYANPEAKFPTMRTVKC